jgi:hypothetical protein
MSSIRSATSNLIDRLRGKVPSKVAAAESDIARLQSPVVRVQRRPAGFMDGFDREPSKAPRLASLATSATPAPRAGMTSLSSLHRDGFEAAARKPVELAPRLAPAVEKAARARINVMRF